MLGWIFKKNGEAAEAAPAPEAEPAALRATWARQAADDVAVWQAKLAAAAGDDAAVLDIARQAPSIAVKCAAVAAMTEEAALRLAEREFRTHDRRVHSAAKQRFDAAVAQRLARERAARLIETGTALLAEATIPTNRLVELDRAWQALDPALLDEAQKTQFADLSVRLTELTRERGERELQTQRWTAAARQALVQLNAICADAAAGTGEPGELARAATSAQTCCQDVPDNGQAAALHAKLLDALQQAAHVETRLSLLEALPRETPSAIQTEAPAVDEALPSPADRWQALPPLADVQIATALNKRFEQWQASVAAEPKAAVPEKRPPRKAAEQAAMRELGETVSPLLQQAEAALEAGNLAETHGHLVAIDAAIGGGTVPEPLRARLQAMHAEYAHLKGWQHWGGGRARDDLVQEAQTLATATAAAVADPQQAAKLPVKQLADAIDDLRKRWKELDRLGGATNQTLWRTFDAALKSAYEPVAAHLDMLKARRKENLAARLQLIAALDAACTGTGTGEGDTANAKEEARALAHFQTEWRKLGPVEHTVPHNARDALMARMQASVARVEAPLQEARRAAQHEREQLVARAKALSAEAAASPHGRDLIARVRELQDQWQQHARTLPLARQVENALWAEFKAATDAVFAQRDAACNARDADLLANQAGREALIARLEALTVQTPAPEVKRVLAEVDAEWRQGVDVPRNQVVPLDARFRAARQAAGRHLAGAAQRASQARFDALAAKLAMCDELEGGVAAGADASALADLAARWAAQAALPKPWEQALALRWQRGRQSLPSASDDTPLDTVLLQLESALDIASPLDVQTARRDMKLLAMKAALEGRPAPGAAKAGVDELTAAALAHPRPSTGQSDRLRAIMAALRAKEDGIA